MKYCWVVLSRFWIAALAALVWAAAAPFDALANPLRPAPDARQRLCIIPPAALRPLFVTLDPSTAGTSDQDDEDDNDGDEEEDDGDEDEEDDEPEDGTLGGFRSADGTCIAPGGALSASIQVKRTWPPNGISSRLFDASTIDYTGNLQLVSRTLLDNGADLRTSFGLQFEPAIEPGQNIIRLTDAWISLDGWKAGFAPSIFNFWSGENFYFGKRIPARSAIMTARTFQITDTWSLSIAAETFHSGEVSPPSAFYTPPPAARWPDAVANLSYAGELVEFRMAGAIAAPRASDNGSGPIGAAAMVGVQISTDLLGRPQTFLAQLSATRDAPVFLGTQADMRIVRRIVENNDVTRGLSFQVSSTRQWSDRISTSAYLSHMRLDFPELGTGSTAQVWSGAANIAWAPVKGMSIALETGLSHSRFELPGRTIQIDLGGKQLTALLWMNRWF